MIGMGAESITIVRAVTADLKLKFCKFTTKLTSTYEYLKYGREVSRKSINDINQKQKIEKKNTTGLEPISYREALLSIFLHASA
jgi:hypothetical protein